MAAHPPLQSSSSKSAGKHAGPALLPVGHHEGKPGVPLTRPVTVIGSRSTARIHLISSTVSKAHALLVKCNGGMYIRDLASRSHVYVNGEEVREADLSDGDLIKIGSFTFKYVAGPVRLHGPGGAPAPAQLDVTGGDFPIPIDQRVMLIGRRGSDDVVLVEESVSTAHAVIFEMDGERYVRDLGSRTGTFVNGVSTHQHKLSSGDVIRVGESDIKYTATAAEPAPPETAGESATGYALEAPHDEIQAAPGDEHGDTIGGLDLVGELVREEVEQGRKPERERRRDDDDDDDDEDSERLQWRRPAHKAPPLPIETPDEIEEPAAEFERAAKDEIHQAQELEPLAPAREAAAQEAPAPEPLPLEGGEKAAAARAGAQAPPSADIEDLAAELLGEESAAAESLSGATAKAETTVPAAPVEPESREAEETEETDEAGETDEVASRRRGWRAALPEEDVQHRPPAEASKDAEADVIRFPDTLNASEADESARDDESAAASGAGAGTALLDHGALAPEAALDRADEDFNFTDSLAAAPDAPADEPASLSAAGSDLKLDLGEPTADTAAAPTSVESVDLSGIDLGIKDEAPSAPELHLDVPGAADEAAPALDFSVKEPVDVAPPALEPPPPLKLPPLKLSDDAEALASATEALTKRQRGRKPADKPKGKGRRGKKSLTEAVAEEPAAPEDALPPVEPIEPFAFEEPSIDIPPIEQLEATIEPMPVTEPPSEPPTDEQGTEVLEETQPTPESALDLDQATDTVTLDDDAIARALVGDVPAATDALSDTTFRRDVENFAGDTVGDLVEPAAPQAQEQTAPDDELVVPRAEDVPRTPPGFDPFKIGANQENFLGGVPLPRVPLHKPKPRPVEAVDADPVDELIAEIDTAAANAERARVETTGASAPSDAGESLPTEDDEQTGRAAADVSAAPFLPLPPAVPRMPRRPRPIIKRGVELSALPAHVDESIPPFKGNDATAGTVTTAFDGLAMPPVRQADVFSQMSPPALAEPGTQRDQADDPRQASGIMTPMDLIGLRREPSAGAAGRAATEQAPLPAYKRRPRPTPGAFTVPEDAMLGGGALKSSPEPITPPGFPSPREEAGPELAVEEEDEGLAAGRRRVRPALPDAEAPVAQRRPPVIYADDVEIDAAAQRRRYVRRARVLTVIGLLLVVAAAVGTYLLVPVRSTVEASITYKNMAERTKRERDELQRKQLQQLAMDHVRRGAIKYVLQTPEVNPGFLEDTEKYTRVVSNASWRESNNVWTLVIPYEGTQREPDRVRMKALATALWEDNKSTLGRQFLEARSAVERLQESIKNNERRAQELGGEIASLRLLYEKRPSGDQVKSLESELAKRETAWKRAVAAVKESEADLNRLKAGASPAAAPAEEQNDAELANMQRALGDLQTKADRNRDQSTEEARKAREQLATSLESFKKEITSAGATVPGSPEMRAYIESAQKMFETTREVVAEMVRRQEQQFNSIMELKSRLNEKMEARRSDMWRADRELQDLTERLAILTRQYNAAVGGGLKNEAEQLKAKVEETQEKVRQRQELIPVDPGYAEAIQQIELFIDTTKKNINEDRSRTDDLLARLQKSFTSGPQIDKLPADQQELARRLEEKLTAINVARQQYNQSLDVGEQRATDEQLQQQIATLQAGIEARKKQILDQRASAGAAASAEAVKNKQAELDRLKLEQGKAEEGYFAASKDLDAARRAVADARSSFEKLEKLESERNTLATTMKTQSDTLLEKQRELKEAVYPEQPTDGDVRVREGEDRRVMYAAIAGGSLFLLFAGLVTMSSLQAVRLGPGAAAAALAPGDLRPIEHPRPQPTAANGNGQPAPFGASDANGDLPSPAVHPDDDDDDRAPAII